MVIYALEHPQARKLAYRLLERCVELHWDLSPMPELVRGERGKPFFPDFPNHHFNISHSGEIVVCALDSAPVGVDIQKARQWREGLLREVCSPEERDWMRRRDDSQEAFAQLWSMKEARCKHSGRGLRRPISAISVPLPEEGEDTLELDGLRYYLHSGPGWQMCLCGTGEWDGKIHWFRETEIKEEETT